MHLLLIFLTSFSVYCHSFIIPDEITSLLSVVYSNIPTIKKGTDSRLGWGFRLGDRADFQVLVELGPQQYTQPLGNQQTSNTNKRNSIENMANLLYALRLKEKQIQEQAQKEQEKNEATPEQTTVKKEQQNKAETDGAEFLKNWSKSMNEAQKPKLKPKPGLAIGEVDAKSVIPEDGEDVIKTQS